MAACSGYVAKQLQKCLRNLTSFTDGQVCMQDCDWEELNYVTFDIAPNDGLYKGGCFTFKVFFPNNYPDKSPTITCKTAIYHPNIDPEGDEGNVCVSLLSDWSASCTLEDVVQALLFLLYNPNVEDPLSDLVPSSTAIAAFEKSAKAIYAEGLNPLFRDENEENEKEKEDKEESNEDEEEDEDEENRVVVSSKDYFEEALTNYKKTSQEEWMNMSKEKIIEMEKVMGAESFVDKIKVWEEEQERKRIEEEERKKQEEEERIKREEEERLKKLEEEEQRKKEEEQRQKEEEQRQKEEDAKPKNENKDESEATQKEGESSGNENMNAEISLRESEANPDQVENQGSANAITGPMGAETHVLEGVKNLFEQSTNGEVQNGKLPEEENNEVASQSIQVQDGPGGHAGTGDKDLGIKEEETVRHTEEKIPTPSDTAQSSTTEEPAEEHDQELSNTQPLINTTPLVEETQDEEDMDFVCSQPEVQFKLKAEQNLDTGAVAESEKEWITATKHQLSLPGLDTDKAEVPLLRWTSFKEYNRQDLSLTHACGGHEEPVGKIEGDVLPWPPGVTASSAEDEDTMDWSECDMYLPTKKPRLKRCITC